MPEVLIPKYELLKRIHRSSRAIELDVKAGRFPRPLRIGRSVYWREQDVDLFIRCDCEMDRYELERRKAAGEVV